MKRFFFVLFVLLLFPLSGYSQSFQVMPDLTFEFELPSSRWQTAETAPRFLIVERAKHIHDNMMKRFKQRGIESKEEAAEVQLKANELFVFNQQTGSYLEIDFSPLKKDDKPPSKRSIALSAKYTGEELEHEEGLSQVKQKSHKVKIVGSKYAYRVDAEFVKHGEPKRFIGLIGFVDKYWFYIYYTAPADATQDLSEMEELLDSIVIKSAG